MLIFCQYKEAVMSQKKTEQQKKFVQNKQHMEEMQKEAAQAAQKAIRDYKDKNPDADELGYRHMGKAYKKQENPQRHAEAFKKLTTALLTRKDIPHRTQTEILQALQRAFPDITIHDNIWHNPFTVWQRKAVRLTVECNIVGSFPMKGCNTLAELKKRVQAHMCTKTAEHTGKIEISIDEKNVVIGKRVYQIQERIVKGCTYSVIRFTPSSGSKRMEVRVDVLKELLFPEK